MQLIYFCFQKPANILVMGEGPERGRVKIGKILVAIGKILVAIGKILAAIGKRLATSLKKSAFFVKPYVE